VATAGHGSDTATGRTATTVTQHEYQPCLDCDNYGAQDEPVHCTHPWYQTPHCVVCILPQDGPQHTEESRQIE
jgi:hypothetical protein